MTNEVFEAISPRGSMWHRWDPHIHAPGTALNDQYKGADPWHDFLTKVEQSDPPIRALGITDYCGIDGYIETIQRRKSGRLAGMGLSSRTSSFGCRSRRTRAQRSTSICCFRRTRPTMLSGSGTSWTVWSSSTKASPSGAIAPT